MKKRNRNLSRFLAMALAFLLAMPTFSVTAFAAELDDETGTEPSVTVTIDVSEASVPDGADVSERTETVDNGDGSITESNITDTIWSSSETGETETKSETDGGIPGIDDILGHEGEGTWTETTTKTDVTTGSAVEGSQTETDSVTTEGDGFVSGASGSVDGHEDTTVTTSTTVTTTTTTVTKSDETTEVIEGETVKGDVVEGGKTDLEIDPTDKTVIDGSETSGIVSTAGETGNTDVDGLEATATSGTAGHDEKAPAVGKPDAADYLKDLDGYDLFDGDDNYIGTVQPDGTVLNGNQTVELAWDGNANDGWTLNVSAKYEKPAEEILRKVVETYGEETLVSQIMDMPEWNGNWDVESDEDGVTVYVHKETGERLDTYEWLYTYVETVTMSQLKGEATLNVTVRPGANATLDVTMGDIAEADAAVEFSGTTRADMMDLVLRAMQEAYAYRYYGKGYGSLGYQSSHLFWDQDSFTNIGFHVKTKNAGSTVTVRKDPSTDTKSVIDGSTNKNGFVTDGDDIVITAVVSGKDGYLWGQIDGRSDKWIRLDLTDFDMDAFKNGTDVAIGIDGDAALTDGAIQSTVLLNLADGKTTNNVWLRELTLADGTKTYVYCAQRGYDAITGTDGYELVSDGVSELQYIAQNGYWGTADSLARLLELVADNDELSGVKVDEGMALAVTQAAIWAKQNGIEFMSDPFTQCYLYVNKIQANKNSEKKIGDLDDEEIEVMRFLFEKLLEGSAEDKTTQFITSESITSTTIKVNSKVEDIDAAVAAAEDAADAARPTGRYDTDLSFTIAVVPDRMNGDNLKVIVYNGKDAVGEYDLYGEDVQRDGETYTIRNIVLTDGIGVSVELTGAQTLSAGAYLFRSEISQDQVGVSDGTGSRSVDVTVKMNFAVVAGTTGTASDLSKKDWAVTWDEYEGYEQVQTRTDTTDVSNETRVTVTTVVTEDEKTVVETETTRVEWHDEWSETYDRPVTPPEEPEEPVIPDEPTPRDPEPPVEDIPDEEPPLSDEPDVPEEDIPDEDVPTDDVPEIEEEEIPDEDVPLSDVPMTGDDTDMALYGILMAVSVVGLCGLAVTGKKRDEF